eukprot:GILJ01001582.1.p1 GENE.GILJ01001582.1~~GILJ01001582.1.p1  ORF type:complete len:347 (-),score=74.86 GILJ01001582.1:153-1193(-)
MGNCCASRSRPDGGTSKLAYNTDGTPYSGSFMSSVRREFRRLKDRTNKFFKPAEAGLATDADDGFGDNIMSDPDEDIPDMSPSNIAKMAAKYKGDEAQQLNQARDAKDIPFLAHLLSSNKKVKAQKSKIHPWADNPKTVGALAASQLAIFAGEDDKKKRAIMNAGGLQKLVKFLAGTSVDKKETAVIALVFLSEGDADVRAEIRDNGAFRPLITLASSKKPGMRAAVIKVLRNLYFDNEEAQNSFIEAGGIRMLIQQLAHKSVEVVAEALIGLEDLIVRGEDLIAENAEMVKDAINVKTFKKLLVSPTREVKDAATYLQARFDELDGKNVDPGIPEADAEDEEEYD